MTEGIIARFRTMAIVCASVVTGHAIASMIKTMIGIGIVIAVALLVGFRPTAGPVEWLAAITFALIWLGVAFGLVNKGSPETANNVPGLLLLMPFLGSGFGPLTRCRPGCWCACIALIGHVWAKKLCNRDPVR